MCLWMQRPVDTLVAADQTPRHLAISKLSQLALWNLIILFPSWHNVLGKENRKSGEVEDILFFFGSKPWRHNCHRQALQKTARWQAEGKWVSYKRHADTQQFCWTTMSSWLLPCYTDKGLLKALGIHSWRTNCLWVIWISLWNCALCAFCFAQIMILIKKSWLKISREALDLTTSTFGVWNPKIIWWKKSSERWGNVAWLIFPFFYFLGVLISDGPAKWQLNTAAVSCPESFPGNDEKFIHYSTGHREVSGNVGGWVKYVPLSPRSDGICWVVRKFFRLTTTKKNQPIKPHLLQFVESKAFFFSLLIQTSKVFNGVRLKIFLYNWSRLESPGVDHSRPPGTESALIAPASEFTFVISFETALDWLRNQTKKTCV